ncbi:hypothetical protein GCM10010982_10020 [Bowmanella pacifica]|uniref:Uncharacterized protein n=1 Tax=Bowmanella pacifica TaxID=502051 RepID=A0A917YU28_9ALTE|nr:hypothetical protein GCM10010982_10020 [Bowmanella pacifica]
MFKEGNTYTVLKDGVMIGHINGDELIITTSNNLLYRIDVDEIYTISIPTDFVGEMDGLTGRDIHGNVLFELELVGASTNYGTTDC